MKKVTVTPNDDISLKKIKEDDLLTRHVWQATVGEYLRKKAKI